MREKVEEVLNQIRPSLQADGGDVELVDIVDGVVKLKLKGACYRSEQRFTACGCADRSRCA
jgi:Fe-S cluster biogenesis protein NfuA